MYVCTIYSLLLYINIIYLVYSFTHTHTHTLTLSDVFAFGVYLSLKSRLLCNLTFLFLLLIMSCTFCCFCYYREFSIHHGRIRTTSTRKGSCKAVGRENSTRSRGRSGPCTHRQGDKLTSHQSIATNDHGGKRWGRGGKDGI